MQVVSSPLFHAFILFEILIVIRLAMIYGVEGWLIKKLYVQKMSVIGMRMLRLMCIQLGMIELEMSTFGSIYK